MLVKNLNITIKKGDIYGFLGRNGAGKTTTLKMIMGLAKPTSGEIENSFLCFEINHNLTSSSLH